MAGGDSQILRTPYPKGEDGWVAITSNTYTKAGAGTGAVIFGAFTAQYAFKCMAAEVTAQLITDADGDFTILVNDDTATPKVIVAATVLTDIVAGSGGGAVQTLSPDRTVTINAGAIVKFTATHGDAADVCDGLQVTLWVKPVN